MRVVVVYNTPVAVSPEHRLCHEGVLDEVRHVEQALRELGYPSQTIGVGENMRRDLAAVLHAEADVVFNLCESVCGYSYLQPCFAGYLELLGVPFTGSTAAAMTLATDKARAKAIMRAAGLHTAESWDAAALLGAKRTWDSLPFPLIVKPSREGGSIGIDQDSVAATPEELRVALTRATTLFGSDVLVERYISGREFSVGLLGNDNPTVLPFSEPVFLRLPEHYVPIVSYQAKWESDSLEYRQYRRICPAQVEPDMAKAITEDCRKAFRAIGLSGYGRIDLRWDERTGRACILDVNANPDLTGYGCPPEMAATLPMAAAAAGISYPQLIDSLIHFAIERCADRCSANATQASFSCHG